MRALSILLLVPVLSACSTTRGVADYRAGRTPQTVCVDRAFDVVAERVKAGVEACWGEGHIGADTIDVFVEPLPGGVSYVMRHSQAHTVLFLYEVTRSEVATCPVVISVYPGSPLWGDAAGRARDYVDGRREKICRD
ncbi:MAG: hypothetical protein KDJ14_16035 [Xanthomonadales bacterium]|nr:hypothetical protein [Xanthomonadales bacterium]